MEEIDLKELIAIFMRKKFLIISILIISGILGAIYTINFMVPEYQSTTKLILVQVREQNQGTTDEDMTASITATDINLNSNIVHNYTEVVTSKMVANQVIQNLNLNMTVEEFLEGISVVSLPDTEVIEITVTNTEPELACTIANEIAAVFVQKTEEIFKVNNIYVLDTAEVDNIPVNIHLIKNIIIAAFIGLIIVSAYILLINTLDTTVKTDTDIERILKVPVLTSIVYTDDSIKKKTKSKSSSSSSSYDSLGKRKTTYGNGGKI